MINGVAKEGGRWRIKDTCELSSDLVLRRLRVGEGVVEGGGVTVDLWQVRDVDGGMVWIPAMYSSEKNGIGQVELMDEEQRGKLMGFVENGWPVVLAIQLAFGEWDETVFGSKEKVDKKHPKEVAMVAVAGPDNRGKSMVTARLGYQDEVDCEAVSMDCFSSDRDNTEVYCGAMESVGRDVGTDEVLELVDGVRKTKKDHVGPVNFRGMLCRLANIVSGLERKRVLMLDMPGVQAKRDELEVQDIFYLFSVPYVWYEGGEGESLAEKVESGLAWLMDQLPEKVEEFKKREEMFKQAVMGGY